MKTHRQALGKWGEDLAEQHLLEQGYQILERNARTPYGELDLVARQEFENDRARKYGRSTGGSVIVFVEVKTRATGSYGPPEESVTARKQAHLLAAAQAYLQEHTELEQDWRVDVIAIQRRRLGQQPLITHFENALAGIDPE